MTVTASQEGESTQGSVGVDSRWAWGPDGGGSL
jgi:hypothetical protein